MPSNADTIQRFLFENHNVRGAIAHLERSYQTILGQHAYPPSLRQILGETLLAASMLSNSMKYKGQLTIQFQSDGPIRMLVAKCNHKGHIRGLAQWEPAAMNDEIITSLGEGQLVITIERDDVVRPYQSIVPLNHQPVSQALEHYFAQSEQLPAKFLTCVANGHAVGLMLQMMPGDDHDDGAFWTQVAAALDVAQKDRLLKLANPVLLSTLYPEFDIRLFESQAVEFHCSCTVSRMEDAIKTYGQAEAEAILTEKHRLVVTCEYCGNEYAFSRDDVDRIFIQKNQ